MRWCFLQGLYLTVWAYEVWHLEREVIDFKKTHAMGACGVKKEKSVVGSELKFIFIVLK